MSVGEPNLLATVPSWFPKVSMINTLWKDDRGQDIAEYAVMLALILILVMASVKLVGSNANNAFSSVASSLH